MLEGRKLPRQPAHLAQVVSIAFIGPGRPRKESLSSIFRVRQQKLRRALLWFKEHNPHYGDVDICDINLNAYPEDDIPVEIMAVARHCPDAGVVEEENGGYVPGSGDDDVGTEGKCYMHS